jgi:hypothetical protein
VCTEKSPKPRRRGYGIREDEYDDDAMRRSVEFEFIPETRDHLAYLLKEYEVRERSSHNWIV